MKTLLELHSETPGDDGNALISQEDALCVQIAALCHDLGEPGLGTRLRLIL